MEAIHQSLSRPNFMTSQGLVDAIGAGVYAELRFWGGVGGMFGGLYKSLGRLLVESSLGGVEVLLGGC